MKTTTIEVRISEEEKDRFQALADAKGVSLSAWVREMCSGTSDEKIVGTAGEILVSDVRKQADSVWFMKAVWPKILDDTLKKASGKFAMTGELPHPPSNADGRLTHETGCDCARCRPPKESKEPARAK